MPTPTGSGTPASLSREPEFVSLALTGRPDPDWADVVLERLPARVPTDPAFWTKEIFRFGSAPGWVQALMGLRQVVVGVTRITTASWRSPFHVSEVVGEEALVSTDAPHLAFTVGVAVDAEDRLLRLTTAVWFHGWRGRLYFIPVRFLHDPVTRAMMRRAVRRVVRQVAARS